MSYEHGAHPYHGGKIADDCSFAPIGVDPGSEVAVRRAAGSKARESCGISDVYEGFRTAAKSIAQYFYPPDNESAITDTGSRISHPHQRLGDVKILAVVSDVKQDQLISSIDLSGNDITDSGICDFAWKMHSTTPRKVKCIQVGKNNIGDRGAETMAQLMVGPDLEQLDLSKNKLTHVGVIMICKALSQGSTSKLAKLDFSRNTSIGNKGLAAICNVSHKLTRLNELRFAGCQLTDDGVSPLVLAIEKGKINVSTLDLGWNDLGDISATALSMAIAGAGEESRLHILDLAGNSMGDEGVVALANSLREVEAVSELDMRRNNFRSKGADCLRDLVLSKAAMGMRTRVYIDTAAAAKGENDSDDSSSDGGYDDDGGSWDHAGEGPSREQVSNAGDLQEKSTLKESLI